MHVYFTDREEREHVRACGAIALWSDRIIPALFCPEGLLVWDSADGIGFWDRTGQR